MASGRIDLLVPDAIKVLIEIAQQRGKITYKDLGVRINAHPRVINHVLGRIRDLCVSNGWPLLTALGINKKTCKPGSSFYDGIIPENNSEEVRMEIWNKELNKVYSYGWKPVLLKYLEKL